ncbi:MAG: hypothetical protein RMJ56_02210 [Gemmataceae bacterium]|nr:hypothetical protein [Gemmataceae bacterium]
MFWLTRVVAPLALMAGLATTASLVVAEVQPPLGQGPSDAAAQDNKQKGDKKGKSDKKDARPEPTERPRGPLPRPDATVEAWVKVLLERITDPHDVVRESARMAVIAVGPPALPALEQLVEGRDAAKAVAAQKLIQEIHRNIQRRDGGDAERGRGPWGWGDGPWGRGGPWGLGPRGPGEPMGPPERPARPAPAPPEPPSVRPAPQPPEGPAPGRPPAFERLFGGLKLTERQQGDLRELLEAQAQKMRDLADKVRDGIIARRDIPQTIEMMQKDVLEKLKKVLNDDQFQRLLERLPEGRFPLPDLFGPGRPDGNNPRRPERPDSAGFSRTSG